MCQLKEIIFLLCFLPCLAFAQGLSNDDIAPMHETYKANQARFKRDYVGKSFKAKLPLSRITESLINKGSYRISLGNSSIFSDVDCVVSDKPNVDKVMDWNTGDLITVSGRVTDHVVGSIILEPCQVSR
jgi:hypothetical protein